MSNKEDEGKLELSLRVLGKRNNRVQNDCR